MGVVLQLKLMCKKGEAENEPLACVTQVVLHFHEILS